MKTRGRASFLSITCEGSLLPTDLLARIAALDKDIPGLRAADYHLAGEKLSEAYGRAWSSLQVQWRRFRDKLALLPETDKTATSLTRNEWLLPLFRELGFGNLQPRTAQVIEEREYPVSHSWEHVPIHLLGCGRAGSLISLDKRTPGVIGATRQSPHSMLQELLNRSEGQLWGILSNGLSLRLLRDSAAFSRQAYVEFDLQAMFDGEHYSDFILLWLLCHNSRFESAGDSPTPSDCWLEKWAQLAVKDGTRAMSGLRRGVELAIEILGRGFLSQRRNQALKDRLRCGELDKQDYYRQLLRLVYRLIFMFVAEDRDLLLLPLPDDAPPEHPVRLARRIYSESYSTGRLRALAAKLPGSQHGDLWQQLSLVFSLLGRPEGCPQLALPALGGLLFGAAARPGGAAPDLDQAQLSNRDLLSAIRALCVVSVEAARSRRNVDYRNLDSEELGSIYESLLEQHPELDPEHASFSLRTAAGSERKTSGSYYTPDGLIQCLLDSALEPVVAARLKDWRELGYASAEAGLLALKVVDPACGSGHFLIAAARRIARRLAALRTGEEEPAPLEVQHAKRDVISRCIYGVDLNPLAVELCKVSLWLEAIEPGKPLSFLDAHIRTGNSLIGADMELIEKGIPNEAYKVIGDDNPKHVTLLKRLNKSELAPGQLMLDFYKNANKKREHVLQMQVEREAHPTETPEDIRKVAQLHEIHDNHPDQRDLLGAHDAWCLAFWCAAFLAERSPTTQLLTSGNLRMLVSTGSIDEKLEEEIGKLAKIHKLFHWKHVFAHVWDSGGGFDCVLSNPPWERVKLQEKEFFDSRDPAIAKASNKAERNRLIKRLASAVPESAEGRLYIQFKEEKRQAEAESHMLRTSGIYPLCGRGDVNTYAVFAERMRQLLAPNGRAGCIVQSDIASSANNRHFFQELMESQNLVSFYDFVNMEGLFPHIHRTHPHFCLLTMSASDSSAEADFAFWITNPEQLRDASRHYGLSASDIALLNPKTRTCPVFRNRRDAEINIRIYKNLLTIGDKLVGGRYVRLIDLGDHAEELRYSKDLVGSSDNANGNLELEGKLFLRLQEAKLVHQFDHRYATFAEVSDTDTEVGNAREITLAEHESPSVLTRPRYWVSSQFFHTLWDRYDQQSEWMLAWRDITNTTNERTCIAVALLVGPSTRTLPVLGLRTEYWKPGLLANLNSYVLDYCVRQMVSGTHLNFGVLAQLPVLPPSTHEQLCPWDSRLTLAQWISPRVLELTYTAWDLAPFARDVLGLADGEETPPPYRWDEARRFAIRCELDAAYFHLYGIERDDVDYIMETFPIVKRKDEARWRLVDGALIDMHAESGSAALSGGDLEPARNDDPVGAEHTPPVSSAAGCDPPATSDVSSTATAARGNSRKGTAKTKKSDLPGEGVYRTKQLILELYDSMASAKTSGAPYATILSPPPGDPGARHGVSVIELPKIGVLAFGSLIDNPGSELAEVTERIVSTTTPFGVEYGRLSQKRGGGPTLVPREDAEPVAAKVLVLKSGVNLTQAQDILYRRELGRVGDLGVHYSRSDAPNAVLIDMHSSHELVQALLYTNFNPQGKVTLSAEELATAAIQSVASVASEGEDGISYLINAMQSGVQTALTSEYEASILKQTKAATLPEALAALQASARAKTK